MSDPYAAPAAAANRSTREFWLHRLHSLTGVIPLGAFLAEHYWTNSKAALGAVEYDKAVEAIQAMPMLIFIEFFGILLPLVYHAVYGLYITASSRGNLSRYGYKRNLLYQWQRTTGIIAFIYITYHVASTRFYFLATNTPLDYQWVARTLSNPVVFTVYLIGVLAVTFHFANGFWNFLISWGITVSARAQRLSGYACAGIGAVLLALALNSLLGFTGRGIAPFQKVHTAVAAAPQAPSH